MRSTHWRRFNPRTREGCDMIIRPMGDALAVSIHAPVKGATDLRGDSRDMVEVSIHAPVKGATNRNLVVNVIDEFQSTHP